ncbi:UNVERIFIED_ORG: hypothetical protein GGD44_001838 [Rhizobium esperanzae]
MDIAFGFAEHRRSAGKEKLADTMLAHDGKQRRRRQLVQLQIQFRIAIARGNIGIGGEMENRVRTIRRKELIHAIPIEHIKLLEAKIRAALEMVYIAHPAKMKIVDCRYPITQVEKAIAEMAADKSGPSCYQGMHVGSSI